jgi:hypothetical protein
MAADAFYPVGLGFFDFGIDYFDLLPERVFTELKAQSHTHTCSIITKVTIPTSIKQRLDALVNNINCLQCYRFVSANTAACDIKNFVYFNDLNFGITIAIMQLRHCKYITAHASETSLLL